MNGKPHGPRMEWYDNGGKKEVGQFSNGKETGSWTYYNKDGTVDGTEEY
jgi:antitoxin component YwqK of YwqJK toxin-antitoxin module